MDDSMVRMVAGEILDELEMIPHAGPVSQRQRQMLYRATVAASQLRAATRSNPGARRNSSGVESMDSLAAVRQVEILIREARALARDAALYVYDNPPSSVSMAKAAQDRLKEARIGLKRTWPGAQKKYGLQIRKLSAYLSSLLTTAYGNL